MQRKIAPKQLHYFILSLCVRVCVCSYELQTILKASQLKEQKRFSIREHDISIISIAIDGMRC